MKVQKIIFYKGKTCFKVKITQCFNFSTYTFYSLHLNPCPYLNILPLQLLICYLVSLSAIKWMNTSSSSYFASLVNSFIDLNCCLYFLFGKY